MTAAPEPPIESEVAGETPEEKLTRLNFFSDAVRAGIHSAAADILKEMEENGVPDAAAILMTGACQFVAEMHEELATQLKVPKDRMRDHLLSSVELYFNTYCEMTVKESLAMAVAGASAEGKPN